MNEEEKKIIELDIEAKYVDKTEKEFLSRITYEECLYILTPENEYCDKIIKLSVLKICEIIEKLQKENEELKEKENKIYKEVQESLAFEKFLIGKERKPDLFNQGRFYISQIIYDILNDVQNPEGIHKENKCIQYIDYIPVQRVKDKIEELDIKISECEYSDDDDEEYKKAVEKDKLFLLNQKRVLQELLEKRK